MTGAKSRAKGTIAELEVARLLHDELGTMVTRNLRQSREGGHDLDGLPVALEVKRYAVTRPGLLATWWEQATRQAERAGLPPALAYRPNRAPWLFVVPLRLLDAGLPTGPGLDYTATLPLPAFCALVRERLIPAPGKLTP